MTEPVVYETLSVDSTLSYTPRAYVRDLWERRHLAWFLAMGNVKARNASTALGMVWWVLNPLLLGLVYYVVFGLLFGGRDISYLMSGMFVFHFTSRSLTGGAGSILSNAKLLANIRFPRLVLPLSNIAEATVGFLGSLIILFLIAGGAGRIELSWNLLFLPLLIAMQIVFNLGLSSFAARLAVPFRDVNNVLPYVSRLWLYASPIIWPLEKFPEFPALMQRVLELNPMFTLISLYRFVILGDPLASNALPVSIAWVVGVGVLGVYFFVRNENKMVRAL